MAGALLKGWQVNNIGTLLSGTPFTVRNGFNRSGNLNTTSFSMHDRPNVKPGCDPILGGSDRYLAILPVQGGGVQRAEPRQPRGAVRTSRVHERERRGRVELGRIISTTTTSRQVQLGLKYIF